MQGIPRVVHWLGLHTFTAEGSGFNFLARELDGKPCGAAGKKIKGADSERQKIAKFTRASGREE